MLTPIDIHYLVGFLSRIGQPEDVELELGAMVPDEASESTRDVDVTILRRSGEAVECYRGIEVKAEKRPLDVIAVEQLCIKLNDMPDLTHRAVVSASGYTDTGRRKAEKHGVELLRLDEWDRAKLKLGTEIPPDMKWTNRTLQWVSPRVDFRIEWTGGVQIPAKGSFRLSDSSGRPMKQVRDLNALSRQLLDQCASDCLRTNERVKSAKAGERIPVTYEVTVDNQPQVRRGKRWGVVRGAHITGQMVWQEEQQEPQLKVLLRDRDDTPFVGCLLAERPDRSLVAIAIQPTLAPLTLTVVPISDRLKNKIYRERFPK